MFVCSFYANTIQSLNQYIDFCLALPILPPPPIKQKKCKPFQGKNLNTPLLISFPTGCPTKHDSW